MSEQRGPRHSIRTRGVPERQRRARAEIADRATFSNSRSASRRSSCGSPGVLPQAGLEDRAGVVDIAAAQWKFGRLGKLSRINLRLASGARAGARARGHRGAVAADARVTTPGEASDEALRLSRAYRSNLTALALVALFTGGFFVYSTQSLATLRRRREFAVLHALGVTRGQQLALVLAAARSSARAARCSASYSASPRRASGSR